MPESSNQLICRYLQDAVAAETSFESQFRAFAEEGDDEEVRSLFAQHAQETQRQCHRLSARLEHLGGSSSTAKSMLAHFFTLTPKLAQATHLEEERTTQNLIIAFSVENGQCAMYEALATAARAAGDTATETLAREIQAQEKDKARTIWRLIPSRTKIALNMLTAGEVDPAIETRATENRII